MIEVLVALIAAFLLGVVVGADLFRDHRRWR